MTCTYVVGRYRPAGNMGGEYKEKVPKGSYTRSVCSSLDKMVKEIESSSGGASAVTSSSANAFDESNSEAEGLTVTRPGNDAQKDYFSGGDEAEPDQGGAPPGGGAVPSGGTNFQQIGLAAHNKLREIHGTPAMTLNAKMSDEAEEYAKKLAKLGRLEHASSEERGGDGENLAYACSSEPGALLTTGQATANW